ncbi:MAG: MFS transporter [Sphingobium sp.]
MTEGIRHLDASLDVAPAPSVAPAAAGVQVMAALRALPGTPLRTFLACLGVWTFVNLEQSMFGYAVPAMVQDLALSIQTVGFIISLGFVVAIFGALTTGLLTDRLGRRTMLASCFGLSGLFYALQAFAGGGVGLGFARSAGAGLSAGLSPITSSYVAEIAPPRIRALMVGFLQIGFPLGWFLASMLVVPLLANNGWRAVFLVSLAAPVLAWLIHRTIPETARFEAVKASAAHRRPLGEQVGELFAPEFRRLTALAIVAFLTKGGAYAGLAFFLPTFLHDVRGYDAATSAYVVGLSYGIGIFGYISASIVGEFFLSRRTTIVIWSWSGAVALLAFLWLPHTPIEDIVACGVMAIFSFGTSAILTTFILEQFPTRMRATGASCASASVSLGFAIFPIVVTSLGGPLGWQAAISVCVAPLLILSGLSVLCMPSRASVVEDEDIEMSGER